MQRFSPMLAGSVLCVAGLFGYTLVRQWLPRDVAASPVTVNATEDLPPELRHLMSEGPRQALRITFADLDLQKLADVETVTADCLTRLPASVAALDSRVVRLRGYMKPKAIESGITEFLFVRSTDLCCFGPKGRADHQALVMLNTGTTADYIELRPFDVEGTLRIEAGDDIDGMIPYVYRLDKAVIIQR